MSTVRWPSLESAGVRLRVAVRGDERCAVAMPLMADGVIDDTAKAALARAGFQPVAGLPVLSRDLVGMTVGLLRDAFGSIGTETIEQSELLSAPWPAPAGPLVALQTALDAVRGVYAVDDGKKIKAIAAAAGRSGEPWEAFWSRWCDRMCRSEWPNQTAAEIAAGMNGDLEAVERWEEPRDMTPARDTLVQWESTYRRWKEYETSLTASLDKAEERAADVERLLGETQRSKATREAVAAMRAQLRTLENEALERIAELRLVEAPPAWQAWSSDEASPPTRDAMGLSADSPVKWREAIYAGQVVWAHPHIVDLGAQAPTGFADVDHAAPMGQIDHLVPALSALMAIEPRLSHPNGARQRGMLGFDVHGRGPVALDRSYAEHFVARYPGGEFAIRADDKGQTTQHTTVFYRRDGRVLGVIAGLALSASDASALAEALAALPPTVEPPAAAVVPTVPDSVRRRLQGWLEGLRQEDRSLSEIDRVLGRYSAEQAFAEKAERITRLEGYLDEFRSSAAANGVDAEQVIGELGGVANPRRFAPEPVGIAAWHTTIPDAGLPLTAAQSADERGAYEAIPGLIAAEAADAITQLQLAGGAPMYAFLLPAQAGQNGRVRLLPEDQATPAGWKLLSSETLRPAGLTRDQVVAKLRDWLRTAPVIGSPPATPALEAAVAEPTAGRMAPSASAAEDVVISDGVTYFGVPDGAAEDELEDGSAVRMWFEDGTWHAVTLPDECSIKSGDLTTVESAVAAERASTLEGSAERYVVADTGEQILRLPMSAARWREFGGDGGWDSTEDAIVVLRTVDGVRTSELAGPGAGRPDTSDIESGRVLRVDRFDEQSDAELSAESLDASREPKAPAPRKPRKARGKIEDFGEHIGGARKDLASLRGGGLSVADTENWNDEELRDLVTKDRVWPVDWAASIRDGAEPVVAYAISLVRERIRSRWEVSSRPGYRRVWDPELAASWHTAVTDAAERFKDVKTREDFIEVARHYVHAERSRRYDTYVGVRWGRTEAGNSLGNTYGGKKTYKDGVLEEMAYLSQKEPGALEREWDRLEAKRVKKRWQVANKPKVSRSRRVATEVEIRPQLKGVTRTGVDHREGRDATPEMFMATFGLRGGEWGNWTSQADRQQTLNHAFDAMADLADVLGVPHKALGLNGELAIAFGARGTGGRRAAVAHYEPYRIVVNLTKISGAGSLAHEFAHALDDYLGRMDPMLSRQRERYATANSRELFRSKHRHELVTAITSVVDTMVKRPWGPDRVEHFANLVSQRARETIERAPQSYDRLVSDVRACVAAYTTATCADQFAELYRERLIDALENRAMCSAEPGQISAARSLEMLHEDTLSLLTRVAGLAPRLGKSLLTKWPAFAMGVDQMHTALCDASKTLRDFETGALHKRAASSEEQTDYLAAAQWLDSGRSKAYYRLPIELFARAFESWVFDRLGEMGRRSDYLVHGVEDTRYAPAEGDINKNPYPSGIDRVAINKAMSALATTLKSEVMPDGNVRLFDRGPRVGVGMSMEQVQAVALPAAQQLVGKVQVGVVRTVDDLPFFAPRDVRGAFTPNPPTAWLVAANLPNAMAVERTLAHEVCRHAGLWAFLGERREPLLTAIWAENPLVRRRVDALMTESAESGVLLGRLDATEEALAGLADEGRLPSLNGVERLMAAVRDLLRSWGLDGLAGRISDKDLAYVVGRAEGAVPMRFDPATPDADARVEQGNRASRWEAAPQQAYAGPSM